VCVCVHVCVCMCMCERERERVWVCVRVRELLHPALEVAQNTLFNPLLFSRRSTLIISLLHFISICNLHVRVCMYACVCVVACACVRGRRWSTTAPPIYKCIRTCMHTGWRRCRGCLKLQVSFRQKATNYRALLQKMSYTDKASYASSLPCMVSTPKRCMNTSVVVMISTPVTAR